MGESGVEVLSMQERTSEESASAGPVNAVASQPISTANPSVPQPTAGKVGRRFSWLRRFFLLDERIANVKRAGLSSDKSGWREFETAREAREALSRLSELRLSNGAVLTLR